MASSQQIHVRDSTTGGVSSVPVSQLAHTQGLARFIAERDLHPAQRPGVIGMCRSFEQGRGCRFGSSCRFAHVSAAPLPPPPPRRGVGANDDDNDDDVSTPLLSLQTSLPQQQHQQEQQQQQSWFDMGGWNSQSSTPTTPLPVVPSSMGARLPHISIGQASSWSGISTPLSVEPFPPSPMRAAAASRPDTIRWSPPLTHLHLQRGHAAQHSDLRHHQHMPRTTSHQQQQQQQQQHTVPCEICFEDVNLLSNTAEFTCSKGHLCCSACFSTFIRENWQEQQRNLAESLAAQRAFFVAASSGRHGHDSAMLLGDTARHLEALDGQEIQRRGQIHCFHPMCTASNASPSRIAIAADASAFEVYLSMRTRHQELSLLRKAVDLCDAALREQLHSTSAAAAASSGSPAAAAAATASAADPTPSATKLRDMATARASMMDSYQCRCGFGPISWAGCDDGLWHAGEDTGNGTIDNRCLRCGRLPVTRQELLPFMGESVDVPQTFVEKLKILAVVVLGSSKDEAAEMAAPTRQRRVYSSLDERYGASESESSGSSSFSVKRDLETFVRDGPFPLGEPLPDDANEIKTAWTNFKRHEMEQRRRGRGQQALRGQQERRRRHGHMRQLSDPELVPFVLPAYPGRRHYPPMMMTPHHHHHHLAPMMMIPPSGYPAMPPPPGAFMHHHHHHHGHHHHHHVHHQQQMFGAPMLGGLQRRRLSRGGRV